MKSEDYFDDIFKNIDVKFYPNFMEESLDISNSACSILPTAISLNPSSSSLNIRSDFTESNSISNLSNLNFDSMDSLFHIDFSKHSLNLNQDSGSTLLSSSKLTISAPTTLPVPVSNTNDEEEVHQVNLSLAVNQIPVQDLKKDNHNKNSVNISDQLVGLSNFIDNTKSCIVNEESTVNESKSVSVDLQSSNVEVSDQQEIIAQQNLEIGEPSKERITYLCHNCGEIFKCRAIFEKHYRKSYNKKPLFTCQKCNKQMENKRTFHEHFYRHLNTSKYQCKICSKTYVEEDKLQHHIAASHSLEIELKCSICDKIFSDDIEYKKHCKEHTNKLSEVRYECTECGKMLINKSSLFTHARIHKDDRRHECTICGLKFVQKINFVNHSKLHSGEKNFKCDQCDKSFVGKSQLQRHFAHHLNVRSYKCEKCGKMYKSERDLKVHDLIHSENRPHPCQYCDKTFLSSSKLKQHYNVHTGARPYKCKYCSKDFTNFPNWLKHVRRRHHVDHKTGEHLDEMPSFMVKEKKDNVANEKLIRKKKINKKLKNFDIFNNDKDVNGSSDDDDCDDVGVFNNFSTINKKDIKINKSMDKIFKLDNESSFDINGKSSTDKKSKKKRQLEKIKLITDINVENFSGDKIVKCEYLIQDNQKEEIVDNSKHSEEHVDDQVSKKSLKKQLKTPKQPKEPKPIKKPKEPKRLKQSTKRTKQQKNPILDQPQFPQSNQLFNNDIHLDYLDFVNNDETLPLNTSDDVERAGTILMHQALQMEEEREKKGIKIEPEQHASSILSLSSQLSQSTATLSTLSSTSLSPSFDVLQMISIPDYLNNSNSLYNQNNFTSNFTFYDSFMQQQQQQQQELQQQEQQQQQYYQQQQQIQQPNQQMYYPNYNEPLPPITTVKNFNIFSNH